MARGFVGDPDSFWTRYGAKTILFGACAGLFVILGIWGFASCATTATNTEVAIVVNNITGTVTILENGGMVLHLPFGLSSVYKMDKSQRLLSLTQNHRTKEHPEGEQVNIKTNDGSNVAMDVEVVYEVTPSRAMEVYRELGADDTDDNIEDILRAVTRSEIRSQLGELSTLEIAEAGPRKIKLDATDKMLREYMDPLGIRVLSINAQSFVFDPEYDKIIRERKEADQILTNQKDYQQAAVEEGKRKIAEAQRDKESAIAQLKGNLNKSLLAANGDATRIVTRAEQQAYQLAREGEIALRTAEQEASALEAEGARKAEAMEKLFAAYEHGGEGLVKEQLMKLYDGVIVRARPYALSERVDQIQTQAVRGAIQPAPAAPQGK
jgi:regulator of protease activity HflC (stomatin/prohibitin superfamily)